MTYWLAPALEKLRAEVNWVFPGRDKASDGWIGDRAHASSVSDHNPSNWPRSWSGVVRALDIDNDLGSGRTGQYIWDRLVPLLGKHPALGSGAYLIYNRRIISTDRLREGARRYTGSNPHTSHIHVSVARAASGYNSQQAWGIQTPAQKGITIVRNHYARSDKYSREEGRVLSPGVHLYLHESSKTNSQASNIIGGVGPYSISTHVYAEGEPGDVLEIVLVWQNQRITPRRNSNHFVERVTVDRDGLIRANHEFKRGAGGGDMVFLNVKAAATNVKPIKITRLDSDAYLFGSA